jgi:hypothetical protein
MVKRHSDRRGSCSRGCSAISSKAWRHRARRSTLPSAPGSIRSVRGSREALAMPEAESWVISEPARGYRVSPISEKALLDLVPAQVAVEKLCIAEAIQHGDLAWERRVVAALHHLPRIPERTSEAPHTLNASRANVIAIFPCATEQW